MNDTLHLDAGSAAETAVHLSEEQIDEQLLGELGSAAAEHLAACGQCSARVAEAAQPIADFRDVSMAWSERRSATMPLPIVAADGLVWQRRMGWATTAFALALGISLLSNGHKAGTETASLQPEQAMDAPIASAVSSRVATAPHVVEAVQNRSADRYAGDNRMLQAIDTELDASVESPATLGLEPASERSSSESSQTSLED
jgi:anti-sigma factor RsiW